MKGGRKNCDEDETKTTNDTPQEGRNNRPDSTYNWWEVGVQATTYEIHSSSGAVWHWRPETVCDMRGFYSILHSDVSKVEFDPRVRLTLAFANGSKLIVDVEHDERYESFMIRERDGRFIVV